MNILAKLDSILYSVIKNIDINLSAKEIVFELDLIESNRKTHHTLKLINCTSFLWIEKINSPENPYDYNKCEYYELTSVSIKDIHLNTDSEWLNTYLLDYNVAIEIWETALLLNAEIMEIDQHQYSIKPIKKSEGSANH